MTSHLSISVWHRPTPRACWRLWERFATIEAALAAMRVKSPAGERLVRVGDADPNEDGRK